MKLMTYKRWLIGGIVVTAISLLFWFVGPLLVAGESRPLEPVGRRIGIVFFVVLVWVAIEAVRYFIARRRNRKLIDELAAGSEDASLSRQEAELLQKRFADALGTLKSAKLGGKNDPQLLYQLPWYMFIGAPGSGKTTALVNSGLRFPLAPAGTPAAALGGVGGTRNCDWWFTDHAVLIDTAGRYTTQDSNASVDQSAWLTFLNLLKRFRPRQPINGIFVTVSVGDLLSSSAAERRRYAQIVRQRVEELQRNLELQFPIYVVATKCDLVAGFSEFFSTFDADQRAQVWGITFDCDLKTRTPENARQGFEKEFPVLVAKLNDILMGRLQEERDHERRARMYPFPQQFASLGPLISEFLEEAFSDTKYATRALVRGLYFTSGTQQGAPIDRLLASLSGSLELRGGGQRQTLGLVGAAKSFFISRLLTDVIFPEAGLAGHSEQREMRLRRLSWALVSAAVLVGVGLIVAWTTSFLGNKSGLQRAEVEVKNARVALGNVGAPSPRDLPVLIEALDNLQRIAPAIHDPVSDPPMSMGWGLYQGQKVASQVGERYRFALQQGLLPRIALQLEAIMGSPQAKPEAVYAALKTYLMMFDAKRLEEGFFVGAIAELWQSSGLDRDSLVSAKGHLSELVKSGDLQVARFHPLNEQLVAGARDRVSSLSLVDRAHSLLRHSAGAGREWRLSEVVGPLGVGVFERASGVSLADPVPYIYTRDGYRNSIKPRIKLLVAELAKEEVWVLGGRASGVGQSDAKETEAAVLRRFLADYQATWQGVLQDVKVRRIDGIRTAMNVAQILSQADSPLKRLIQAVADQTRLSGNDTKGTAVAAAEEAAKRKALEAATTATSGIFGNQAAQVVGSMTAAGDPVRAQEQAVEQQFSAVHRLAGDGKTGEIDAAIAVIGDIANELVAVQQKISSGLGVKEMPQGLGRAKAQADRFGVPVSGVIKALVQFTEQEASGGVRKEVKAGVGGASSMCQRAVPGRYPFVRTATQDAGVQDFVNVFKSGGDLDAFFNSSLAQYVDKSGGVWRLKATGEGAPPVSAGTLRQFQNADAIRTAFLNGGAAPSVVVDVSLVSGDSEVGIDYDGASHKLRVGSGNVRLAWPARPGIRLTLGGQQVVSADGPWALFRLVDKGVPDPASTGDRLRVSFVAPSGSRALLELRTGSAAFNPFRLRELELFSCPRE